MYLRNQNEKISIRSDDEKNEIINIINTRMLSQSLFKCISLVTGLGNDEILVKGAVCKTADGKIQIFNIIGEYPIIRLQKLDGDIIASTTFEENPSYVNKKDTNDIELEKNEDRLTVENNIDDNIIKDDRDTFLEIENNKNDDAMINSETSNEMSSQESIETPKLSKRRGRKRTK